MSGPREQPASLLEQAERSAEQVTEVYIPEWNELNSLFDRCRRCDPVALRHLVNLKRYGRFSAQTMQERFVVAQIENMFDEVAHNARNTYPSG